MDLDGDDDDDDDDDVVIIEPGMQPPSVSKPAVKSSGVISVEEVLCCFSTFQVCGPQQLLADKSLVKRPGLNLVAMALCPSELYSPLYTGLHTVCIDMYKEGCCMQSTSCM